MRDCLEVLQDYEYPYEIITKSSLVRRDVDLLAGSSDYGLVSMSLFGSLDDAKRKRIELKADPMAERLAALAELNRAGVRTMALLLPILPEYSDDPAELRQVLRAVRAAGTVRLYAGVLRLYGITWAGMKQAMPRAIWGLRDRYQELFFGPGHSVSAGAHVPGRAYRRHLMEEISCMAREEGYVQFQCEDNFFDLWFGNQDEHENCYRYMTHFDLYQERLARGGGALTVSDAEEVARRYRHTPSFLASIQLHIDLLNRLTDPTRVQEGYDA
jgi:DNA repair photolyase